jgi:rhodanese-related sulfurtransferase
MYVAVIFLVLVSLFLTIENLRAQTHVDSKAYDVLLSSLLKHSVPEISVNALKQDMYCVLLDTRARKEYNVSHLQNAIWVGYDEFDLQTLDTIDKNTRIVVYCSVGYRSEKIAEKIIAAGFTNVQNLYGGIFEWVNQEQKIVDTQNQYTNKIHGYSKTWGIWLKRGDIVYD